MDETQAQEQFEREKRAYFAMRNQLLKTHFGKWVAIVDGKIVAVGDQMSKVAAEAFQKTGKAVMYVTCVGKEDMTLKVRYCWELLGAQYLELVHAANFSL